MVSSPPSALPSASPSWASRMSSTGAPEALRAISQAGSATIAEIIHGFILATLAGGMPRSLNAASTVARSSSGTSDISVVPSVNMVSSGLASIAAIILAGSSTSVVSMTTVEEASNASCARGPSATTRGSERCMVPKR